jgi:hypothetical protein
MRLGRERPTDRDECRREMKPQRWHFGPLTQFFEIAVVKDMESPWATCASLMNASVSRQRRQISKESFWCKLSLILQLQSLEYCGDPAGGGER